MIIDNSNNRNNKNTIVIIDNFTVYWPLIN